ncbi:MFS general substrate transporter [Phlegmacium glaucopus]|nr:MFS general substrate transporter [Phlegmacium glaucopus]
MSILILIYILNYVDRNNVSAARLRGFEEELHLEGSQFYTLLSILYVGYMLMQIPSNMFLSRIGKPSQYLPWCMVIWGILSVCTGFTTNYLGALCTRFFLGFVEAAFFPGALFLISKWYKRNELSERTALLSCGFLLSNAFGSLIASAILNSMEGKLGYSAWRWLFFIEGTITVLVAILSMYILPDFPESSNTWLTPAEKLIAVQRMVEDVEAHADYHTASEGPFIGFHLAISDWKVWWLALSLATMVVSLSFNSYFPTLAATMGYGPTFTLLLCAPPWLLATGVALLVSRHSDREGERCKHITFSLLFGIFGFMLAMSTMNKIIRYCSFFFMTQSYAGFICFLAWASSSVAYPPEKRAVALALINCVSQSGNILGSFIWPLSWGPTYNISYFICIVMNIASIAMCFAFRHHLSRLNHKAGKLEIERGDTVGYRYIL